ncbi:acyltransferase [Myroides sp. DW712]|uniref:acyltransferase n=1 Tax=Myroides sp. DW712 TaxID=3389800 RepID=UPI00397D55AA
MIKKIFEVYRRTFWSCEKYARYIGVEIGENCMISTKNFSSEPYLIKIGSNCRIARGVSFFTHGGIWAQRQRIKEDLDFFGKIEIGDYSYVGQDSKIMAGITIGDNVIIGAGTIVTKSVPDGKVCVGNPGKIVGDTFEFVERIKLASLPTKKMNYNEKKEFLLSLSDDKFIKK